MTPFMQQVDDVLNENASDAPVETIVSTRRTLGEGLHNQVELRALAEQLVCEGNAVLGPHGLALELVDMADTERLAFTLSCGRARAWVVTDVIGRGAKARLDAPTLGVSEREIAGPDSLAGLLLSLIAAGRSRTEAVA
jgi:hypothetical protein